MHPRELTLLYVNTCELFTHSFWRKNAKLIIHIFTPPQAAPLSAPTSPRLGRRSEGQKTENDTIVKELQPAKSGAAGNPRMPPLHVTTQVYTHRLAQARGLEKDFEVFFFQAKSPRWAPAMATNFPREGSPHPCSGNPAIVFCRSTPFGSKHQLSGLARGLAAYFSCFSSAGAPYDSPGRRPG